MERDARKKVFEVLKRFAKKQELKIKLIAIPLRKCDDVPNYLKRMEEAHEKTAHSNLRFRYCLN